MTSIDLPNAAPAHVVLADANVLYSRVLRDYLLYATTRRVITVNWSQAILDDVAEHMSTNIEGFTLQRAAYLLEQMTAAFPIAMVEPRPSDFAQLSAFDLPDEDDREVIAAALAAGADVICTSNLSDFPKEVIESLDMVAMTPDDLFYNLFDLRPHAMLEVHRTVVQMFPGSTDASTIAALRKAQAPRTADLVATLT